jgi:hypothetical protein
VAGWGPRLAGFVAILVQAPRLVLALLAADRLPVAAAAERALLVLAGVATAIVLTGGNLTSPTPSPRSDPGAALWPPRGSPSSPPPVDWSSP